MICVKLSYFLATFSHTLYSLTSVLHKYRAAVILSEYFCMMAPNTHRSSVWKYVRVIILEPTIFRLVRGLWKICALLTGLYVFLIPVFLNTLKSKFNTVSKLHFMLEGIWISGVPREGWGFKPPLPEISKIWQSRAKFPVPWKIHP
jgi:hypothetical protein